MLLISIYILLDKESGDKNWEETNDGKKKGNKKWWELL